MVWRKSRWRLGNREAYGPILAWVCVLLLSGNGACADTNAPLPSQDWVVRSWQTKDGLPQNTVYALLQTRDGYLWVGTGGGLARFDGVRFRNFGLHEGLSSVQISTLAEDRDGRLWVGTRGGGVSRWENGAFRTFSQADGFTSLTVEALAADRQGAVWIGTERGLVRWREGAFTKLGAREGLPEKHVSALLVDSKGALWVSFFKELHKGINDSFRRVELVIPSPNSVYSLCEDRDGYVWAGGGNWQIWKLGEGVSQCFDRTNNTPFQAMVSLAQGSQGPLWIGTRNGGLHYFSESRFKQLATGAELPGYILGLLVDRDGAVWVGGAGLHRLSPKLLRVWGTAQGLEHRAVTSVAEDASGGWWVSALLGGVSRLKESRFSRVKEPQNWSDFPNAYTTLATADRSIWVAGESFAFRFRQGQKTEAYDKQPVSGEAIRAMCEDGPAVWMGTYYSTLLKWENGQIRVMATKGSFGGGITSLVRDAEDTLWIGSAGGLYRWERGKVSCYPLTNSLLTANVHSLLRDPDGTLWIGTLGGGLARLKGGRIVCVTSQQGLADDVISQILADDFGQLWLGCNHGIMRLEREQFDAYADGKTAFVHASLLNQNDGMLNETCSGGHSPTALKTKAGRLLFPTADGLVEIDPQRWLASPAVVPQARIEEIRVDGQLQATTLPLVLPPGSRHLEVHYGAPSLRGADSVHFRFRLEPMEKEWVSAGARRTAYYSNLRPGRYSFRVTAGTTQGDWNQNHAVIAITLRPHLWQSFWFQWFAAAAVCAAAAGWYFHRMMRLEQSRAAQEAFSHQLLSSQEEERKRLASELHDGLGQDLLLIKNRVGLLAADKRHPLEVARQLGEISQNASRAIADVRAISQALRPTALEQVGLTKAVEWMVEQVAGASTTKFSTELENIDGLLEPEKEISLYRVVQEALNNVLKHAQASQVIVEAKREKAELRASVFDNGRGFDPERAGREGEKPGLGLAGMRERAKVLGGRIELQSASGKGTRLTLTVPLSSDRERDS